MKPAPPIYENVLVIGDGIADGEAAARIGGIFAQPNLGLSYLLAARHTIEVGEARQRLNEIALPVAYLQRHALEIGLKDILETAYEIQQDRAWLEALKQDATAEPPAVQSVPFEHDFKKLRKLVCRALEAIGSTLPQEVGEMTKQLGAAELFDHTRFRYLTRSGGKKSFPEPEILRIGEIQEKLETLFDRHLCFQGFDAPASEWNLVTELAGEGEALFQAIQRYVPIEKL